MKYLSERDQKIAQAQTELKAANEEIAELAQSGAFVDHQRLIKANEALYNAMNSEMLYECFCCRKEFLPFNEDVSKTNCLVLAITSVIFPDGSRADYDPADTRHLVICEDCEKQSDLLGYLKKRS